MSGATIAGTGDGAGKTRLTLADWQTIIIKVIAGIELALIIYDIRQLRKRFR
jgi:hypothetical protein